MPPKSHAQNARLNHNITAAEGTADTTEGTTEDMDQDMDAATEDTDMEDAVPSGAGPAIPPSGRERSSAGRRSVEPSWVRLLEGDSENDR